MNRSKLALFLGKLQRLIKKLLNFRQVKSCRYKA